MTDNSIHNPFVPVQHTPTPEELAEKIRREQAAQAAQAQEQQVPQRLRA